MIQISAVICTYKRAEYLRAALESLCRQTLPRDQYEIIVIDNCGEVETEKVVAEFRSEDVALHYLVEPQLGLSHARNRALREARGTYLAYLDDDARADEHWLAALVDSFANTEAAAVGGRVWLDWNGEKPVWVNDAQLSLFTFVDHGEQGHALGEREYLVGANIAFRSEALKAIGGFDVRLGRHGAVLLSGEEAKVLWDMSERGWRIYYEPKALVWHSVHPSRRRPTWLLRRMFWDGASQPLIDDQQPTRRILLRSMLFDLRQCFHWFARALAATLRGRKQSAWESLLSLSQRAGRVRTRMRMLTVSEN